MRALAEWIGMTPDAAIPDRVKLRIWGRDGGRCCECTRKCGIGGEPFQFDHRVALINGGQNRESNLRLVCVECHKGKTKQDMAEKSKVYRVRKRHVGIRKRSTFLTSKDGPFKKKLDGTLVRRSLEN